MSYTGRYVPTNPKKYKGNPTTIYYRSLWERKFMVYCDKNPRILEWGSEEIIIPYLLPTDGKVHRYFPDFYIKVKRADNKIRKMIIEVKPENQSMRENVGKLRHNQAQYIQNMAKWEAARAWCKQNCLLYTSPSPRD